MLAPLTLPAPAKLNLFLHIIGRRLDGYHKLQTLFQFLDINDNLTFLDHEELNLECNITSLATKNNLVLKAARLLQIHTNCTKGVKIFLTKRLPINGGLGGGSSDAATTLHGLNIFWNLCLSNDELATLGLQLGADLPVFIHGFAAFAEGIGELLTAVEPKEYWYLVLQPNCHVNTMRMFNHQALTRDTPAIQVCAALDGLYKKKLHNDFQSLVRMLYPEVDKCLMLLDHAKNGSLGQAMMSGSGACVFAPFASREQAEATIARINVCVNYFIVRGINKSPLQHRLINQHNKLCFPMFSDYK